MKKIVVFLIFINYIAINAQETKTKMGPILTNFGSVFQIENPDLVLQKDNIYKVIFDVYTDPSKDGGMNPLLNTVARYLNMHAQHGVPATNMKVVVILHGAPTKNALNTSAYTKLYKTENPNAKLINALKKADVEIFVCGQSYLSKGFDIKDKSPDVKLALSALTALVEFQTKGYQLITFN